MTPSPFSIGDQEVPPGSLVRLELPAARLPTHTMLHLPVAVANGIEGGARLWLSAAIHGDELNGMEVIRQVLERLDPARMRGVLVAAPIVNVFGFVQQSRYLPDRRDLNRSFPGTRRGSLASRLARLFMDEIVARCTHGIDLHTAAPPRINLPQVRGNLKDPETRRCAEAFGAPVMIDSAAPKGALRAAATKRGVATLLYEAGEPLRFQPEAVRTGVEGILRMMRALGMIDGPERIAKAESFEAARTKWVRAQQSGVLYLEAGLGRRLARGEVLGWISDPLGDARIEITAPIAGMVIGHTTNPLVHRGDAVLHLAAPRPEPSGTVDG